MSPGWRALVFRRTPFVFVGNGEYELEGMDFGKRPQIADGRLSLYIAPNAGRLAAVALPARALLGKLEEYDKFESFRAASVSIDLSRRVVGVALDGEIRVLEPPLRFGVERNALRVIVPPGP